MGWKTIVAMTVVATVAIADGLPAIDSVAPVQAIHKIYNSLSDRFFHKNEPQQQGGPVPKPKPAPKPYPWENRSADKVLKTNPTSPSGIRFGSDPETKPTVLEPWPVPFGRGEVVYPRNPINLNQGFISS